MSSSIGITNETGQEDIFNQFDQILTQLGSLNNQICIIRQNMKVLEKNIKLEMRTLKKESVKSKPKISRVPSGFAKPCKISKELCAFMNKPDGTEMARTDVTRALNKYIKEHNLQQSRIIIPDDKLKNLLDVNDGDELTFFTIQKYMNKHFLK